MAFLSLGVFAVVLVTRGQTAATVDAMQRQTDAIKRSTYVHCLTASVLPGQFQYETREHKCKELVYQEALLASKS